MIQWKKGYGWAYELTSEINSYVKYYDLKEGEFILEEDLNFYCKNNCELLLVRCDYSSNKKRIVLNPFSAGKAPIEAGQKAVLEIMKKSDVTEKEFTNLYFPSKDSFIIIDIIHNNILAQFHDDELIPSKYNTISFPPKCREPGIDNNRIFFSYFDEESKKYKLYTYLQSMGFSNLAMLKYYKHYLYEVEEITRESAYWLIKLISLIDDYPLPYSYSEIPLGLTVGIVNFMMKNFKPSLPISKESLQQPTGELQRILGIKSLPYNLMDKEPLNYKLLPEPNNEYCWTLSEFIDGKKLPFRAVLEIDIPIDERVVAAKSWEGQLYLYVKDFPDEHLDNILAEQLGTENYNLVGKLE